MQELILDGRSVPLKGRPNPVKLYAPSITDVDYRKARAFILALRGQMERTGAVKTSYDGRTVEKPTASTMGYKFQVWGSYYIWEHVAPLVREGKERDSGFRCCLHGGEPRLVDIVQAQETILGILNSLKPIGRT